MVQSIQDDHMPVNNYDFLVTGLPKMTILKVDGLEEELETTELPDRSPASGGQVKPVEFSISIPLHHEAQITLMNVWWQEGQDPVLPTYKKPAVMIYKSLTGSNTRKVALINCFIFKRKWPDADQTNEGDMAEAEYSLKANVAPIP
jgi:hypothetical protein